MPAAYSARDAAHELSVSESEIRRLVKAGVLGRVPNVGRRLLIARAEVERFAAQGVLADTDAA